MLSRRLVSCIIIGSKTRQEILTPLQHTHPRPNGSLHSFINVFAQVAAFFGSIFLPQVLSRVSANFDPAGDGQPPLFGGLSTRSPSSSSPKRQHTLDLLFDPDEVLDIRPMGVDTRDLAKNSKRVDIVGLVARPKSRLTLPPPYDLIDDFPLPGYTP